MKAIESYWKGTVAGFRGTKFFATHSHPEPAGRQAGLPPLTTTRELLTGHLESWGGGLVQVGPLAAVPVS